MRNIPEVPPNEREKLNEGIENPNPATLKNWHIAAGAAVVGAVLCFCGVMAWQRLFAPVEIPQDAKYIKERAALEAKANADAAAKDSLVALTQVLTDSINVLLIKPQEIHQDYENQRAENWALPADSATALLHQRLSAAEDTYRLRFVYGFNTD
jgi:hypothetical protein